MLDAIVFAFAMSGMPCPSNFDTVTLSTGEVLHGQLVLINEKGVIFEHPALGRLELTPDKVLSAEISDQANGAVMPVEADSREMSVEPGGAWAELSCDPWRNRFDLGVGGSQGNTENANFTCQVKSARESDRMRTALDTAYFFASTRGNRSGNKFTAGAINDWLSQRSPWLIFASGRYDNDEFQSWDWRVGGNGGAGYRLYLGDPFKMTLRAGAGALKEGNSTRNQVIPEALLGAEGSWNICSTQQLDFTTIAYPDLADSGEFRAVSGISWSFRPNPSDSLSLFLTVNHEFQSQVTVPTERNDVRIFGGLGFDF